MLMRFALLSFSVMLFSFQARKQLTKNNQVIWRGCVLSAKKTREFKVDCHLLTWFTAARTALLCAVRAVKYVMCGSGPRRLRRRPSRPPSGCCPAFPAKNLLAFAVIYYNVLPRNSQVFIRWLKNFLSLRYAMFRHLKPVQWQQIGNKKAIFNPHL